MTNDLLITGIPRSGTSYLCSILNNVHNTVVINEPEEIFQLLQNNSKNPISHYYKNIRDRINDSQPITNKIVNGRFIEDTNKVDVRSSYTPNVSSNDFILGTKNTLIYLNTLHRIIEDLPDITLIACVRHPYDTIASWSKVSFPHIRNATPQFLLNYTTGKENESISKILKQTGLAIRYAMWWDYLARIIISSSDRIIVLNYEKMVSDPEATIARIYTSMLLQAECSQPLTPSSPRHHKNTLDNTIISAVNENCRDSAKLLGYTL